MKCLKQLFLVVLTTLPALSKDRPELDGTMQQLFNSLINLQVNASDSERFSSSENRAAIENDLEVLASIKHAFPKQPKTEEPGMMSVLSLFKAYVSDTKNAFHRGNVHYARHRVKTMGNFCLGCHSRNTAGKDFEDLDRRVNQLPLNDFQKAELYAATRQFDKAISSFRLYLQQKPKDEMDFLNFTRGLRTYVRLLVRVKQDPQATVAALQLLKQRKDLPEFDKRLIQSWEKDAKYWTKEHVVTADLTPAALFKRAETLIERSEQLHNFPADESADISLLRATSYLHEILERDPKSKLRGKALYLLGVAHESLQEPYLWDLHRLFYEQCIREFPHSDISAQCYLRYSNATYFGYTGSGGTHIPDEELRRLAELRALNTKK